MDERRKVARINELADQLNEEGDCQERLALLLEEVREHRDWARVRGYPEWAEAEHLAYWIDNRLSAVLDGVGEGP